MKGEVGGQEEEEERRRKGDDDGSGVNWSQKNGVGVTQPSCLPHIFPANNIRQPSSISILILIIPPCKYVSRLSRASAL